MILPLRILFTQLARPGIHMPHDGHTPELLLCGAKPIGFLEPCEEDGRASLEQAVERGELLSYDIKRQHRTTVYIYSKRDAEPDLDLIESTQAPLFALSMTDKTKEDIKNNRLDEHDALTRINDGEIACVVIDEQWLKYGWSSNVVAAVEQSVAEGELIKIRHDFVQSWPLLRVYGQLDQFENMKALESQIQNYDTYPNGPEDRKLIGRLLGYSDQDISLRAHESSWIMKKTEPLRRYCRYRLMQESGTKWKEETESFIFSV